jgi:hypothetical protein
MVDKIEIQKIYFPITPSLRVNKLRDKNSQNNQKEFNQQLKGEGEREDKEKDKEVPHRTVDLHDKNVNEEVSDLKGVAENNDEGEENKKQGKLIDIVI